jgi:hypothetical protein
MIAPLIAAALLTLSGTAVLPDALADTVEAEAREMVALATGDTVVVHGDGGAVGDAGVDAEAGPDPAEGGASDAEEPPEPLPEVELSFSGLISATAFAQDQSFGFGNGQSAIFASDDPQTTDLWFMGGDVRSTRLRFQADTREDVVGWAARGVLEVDFFGAFTGNGPFNDEQPQPRLRLAYVELAKGGTTIKVGQAWSPYHGLVPASVTHVAFPLGLAAAGRLGWRFPGLFLTQRLVSSGPVKLSGQLAAFRGSWCAAALKDPDQVTNHMSPGEAGTPQVEARLDASGAVGDLDWRAYVVGHLDRKDLSGVGERYDEDDELVGQGVQLGARLDRGPWTLQGNGHVGRAMGQQFAALAQFGDIGSHGAWAQVGYDLTSTLGLWIFRGFEDPVDGDVLASDNARLHNSSTAASVIWDAGPYRAGLEWLTSTTEWAAEPHAEKYRAQQISFSVLYSF